jgi:hypothetical protein
MGQAEFQTAFIIDDLGLAFFAANCQAAAGFSPI